MSRTAIPAILGALAMVVAWTAWSTLGLREASEPVASVETTLADSAPPSARPPRTSIRSAEPLRAASAGVASTAVPAPPAAPTPLRDGLVAEHAMPMAVRAPAGTLDASTPAPAAGALPAGVAPDDAVVNRAGMVALGRSADPRATADAAAPADPPRVAAAAHAP